MNTLGTTQRVLDGKVNCHAFFFNGCGRRRRKESALNKAVRLAQQEGRLEEQKKIDHSKNDDDDVE